eukprot:5441613-Alexandrium_andersonii.AAC.1
MARAKQFPDGVPARRPHVERLWPAGPDEADEDSMQDPGHGPLPSEVEVAQGRALVERSSGPRAELAAIAESSARGWARGARPKAMAAR